MSGRAFDLQRCAVCGRKLDLPEERAIGVGQTCAKRVLGFSGSRHRVDSDHTYYHSGAEEVKIGSLRLYLTTSERSALAIASLANDPHRPIATQYAARRLTEERLTHLAAAYVERRPESAIRIDGAAKGILRLTPLTIRLVQPHRLHLKAWEIELDEGRPLWTYLRTNYPHRVLYLPDFHPHDRCSIIPSMKEKAGPTPPWEI